MLGRKRKVWGIEREVLEMVNEAAKETYPNEFVATLRAEEGVVTELLLLPGTIQGTRSGVLLLHMLPIDFSIVGTAHSHPSGILRPSITDLNRFYGRIMVIVFYTPGMVG